MAVQIALNLNVFPTIAEATSPVPLAKLAAIKPADPILVGQFISRNKAILSRQLTLLQERILRVLVASGILEEPAPSEYLPTPFSKELTNRPSIGVLESQ